MPFESCGYSALPPIVNKQLDVYGLLGRRIEYVRRPKAALPLESLTNVSILSVSQGHEIDLSVAQSYNVDIGSIDSIAEIDLEILTGIMLQPVEFVSVPQEIYIQINQQVSGVYVEHTPEIDIDFAIGNTITFEVESVSEIDVSASKSETVEVYAESVHIPNEVEVIVNKVIPIEIETVNEIELEVQQSIGPTISVGHVYEINVDTQYAVNVPIEVTSVTEIDTETTYGTDVSFEIETVHEISLYRIGVSGAGLSNYMLANRGGSESLDQIVTIDSIIDGFFSYFKLDQCLISSSSALLLNSPFKAQLASAISMFEIVNWCPNVGPHELRYENFINFVFIYNVNEIIELQQDGDTAEIIIPVSDGNSIGFSF